MINQSLPPGESKESSAELALADAIAQGLRRHRNASGPDDATTAAINIAAAIAGSSPDLSSPFYLPEAPKQVDPLALSTHLPTAPALVPLATDKLTSEQLIELRAADTPATASKIGVLLINVGAPEAGKPAAIWHFLKDAFNDPRVIEIGSRFWKRSLPRKIAMNGFILPVHAWRRARSYKNGATHPKSDVLSTRSLAEKLIGILGPLGKQVFVEWAVRYAEPSIANRLQTLVARNCDRVLIMPLYPQYSGLTTATICDEVFRSLTGLPRQPSVRVMPSYYDDPHYIDLVASSLNAQLKKLHFEPDVILACYQNIPVEYLSNGDPYRDQCVRTTQLLRDYLKLDEMRLMIAYRPRFGHSSGLESSAVNTVKALAKQGAKSLVLMAPDFCDDGLDTLHDVASQAARAFKRCGGENFALVSCCNDSEAVMLLVTRLAMRELEGWV